MGKARYANAAVALHWLIAIGIFYNLYYGLGFDSLEKSHPDQIRDAIDLHKSIGITVLGLVVLRILWRIGHKPPAPLPSVQPWERIFAATIHTLLYLLILLVPLAGWLHDSAWTGAATHPLVLFHHLPFFRLPFFDGLDAAGKDYWHNVFGAVHGLSAKLLLLVLVLHVAGALKHQFLDHKPELRRMWFGR